VAVCPSCGEDNPERARFCLACGTALAPEAGPRIERKYATALFADIVGSTALAEREDPEVVRSVVGRAFDRLAVEIERYGGLLEKFVGDAVLAVFGVPRSHEDDPERAVRAALDLQDVLAESNRGFAAEGSPELAMRIGVEAGDVLADLQRAEGPRERMLTGDAVNTAARLQAAAEPGQVLVGPVVYAATKYTAS
jgi:class 3 adenylate cyclase